MIVVDTDVISILQVGQGADYERLLKHLQRHSGEQLAATIITYEEQMRGWLSYVAVSRDIEREVQGYVRLGKLVQYFARRDLLPFDSKSAAKYRLLKGVARRTGAMDLKIASIALSSGLPLATRNVRDFERVPGLQLLDWSK